MKVELLIWVVIIVISLVVECATAALVSIWFMIGAIASLIANLLGLSFIVQAIVFGIVSIVTGFLAYPILTKTVREGPKLKSNVENYIGKIAKVDEEIDNISGTGRVTYNGISWAARSSDDAVKIKCEHVKIVKVEGAKLIVEPYIDLKI